MGCFCMCVYTLFFSFLLFKTVTHTRTHMNVVTQVTPTSILVGREQNRLTKRHIYQAWLLYRGFVCSLIRANTGSINTITSPAKLHFLLVYSGMLHSTSIPEGHLPIRVGLCYDCFLRSLNGGHCWCWSAALHIDS